MLRLVLVYVYGWRKVTKKVLKTVVSALGVHALSMLDTPTVVAVVFGTIFVVMAALTAYFLYTCRRREQLNQEQEQDLRQQTYQSKNNILRVIYTCDLAARLSQ